MRTKNISIATIFALFATISHAPADPPNVDNSELKSAIVKSLDLIEKSSKEYLKHRRCFSCHHQALPLLTLAKAKQHGFTVDEENFNAQLQHTFEHLDRGRKGYAKGRGQGGRVDTAGYALWALAEGGWKPDETTAAVAEYILLTDQKRGYWRHASNRPPSEASDVTTTALALYGLDTYATKSQKTRADERRKLAFGWLLKHKPKETEEHVFRLQALHYLGANSDTIKTGVGALLKLQRDDGGWAQKPDMKTDAYATGSVLATLHLVGGIETTSKAYQQGVQYLLKTQLPDGSWYVKSRSRPFQKYFESGFPHGKDQFISIFASCWATQALMVAAGP